MLGLVAAAWQGTPKSLKSSILSGMALFLKTYEMELVDPEKIIRRGKMDFSTNKAALRFACVILNEYNSQQRVGQKLPYRFKG